MQGKPNILPSYLSLSERFFYNYKTGILFWKNGKNKNKKVGTVDKEGYLIVKFNNKSLYVHRIIWKLVFRNDPSNLIDHINGIKTDNRLKNLREATNSQNLRNGKSHRDSRYSNYRGVCWCKRSNKWIAYIKPPGRKQKTLGYFRSEIDAAKAYDKASIQYFGEFANPNKPNPAGAGLDF
jgi:hypothetical protein